MLEYIILGYLYNNSLSENKLRNKIIQQISNFYKVNLGSLYPTLKRMISKQLIILKVCDVSSKDKQYFITAKGQELFEDWLLTPIDISESSRSQLIKIFFANHLDPLSRMKLLTEFELNYLVYLKQLELIAEEFESQSEMEHEEYFERSTLYYGIRTIKTTLEWCQHIRENKPLKDLL